MAGLTIKWNPITHFFRTKKYRYAYFRSASLNAKIKAVLAFLTGSTNHYGTEKAENVVVKVGALDFILPFARLIEVARMRFSFDNTQNTMGHIVATGAAIILTGLLYIPKLFIAALLTLVSVPVLAFMHRFMQSDVDKLTELADKVSVLSVETPTQAWHQRTIKVKPAQTLKTAFNSTDMHNLLARPIYKVPSNNKTNEMVFDWSAANAGEEKREAYIGLFEAKEEDFSFDPDSDTPNLESPGGMIKGVIELMPRNNVAVRAMLETNRFWVTEAANQVDAFDELDKINHKVVPPFPSNSTI